MTKTWKAATGVVGAIAVAGAVGLWMSNGKSSRRMIKKASKAMHNVGGRMQDVAHSMLKG